MVEVGQNRMGKRKAPESNPLRGFGAEGLRLRAEVLLVV